MALHPPLKIMHVIDSAGIYGAEVMLLNLMEEQAQMGLQPLLFSIEPSDKQQNETLSVEAEKRGIATISDPSGRRCNLMMGQRIMQIAEQHNSSLIHSHGYKGDILLGLIPRFRRTMPLVSTVHGFIAIEKLTKLWCYLLLDKLLLRRMDAVINVNSRIKLNTGKAQKYIIENGIPPLEFTDRDAVARMDPEISHFCKEGFIVGAISRLSSEKGIRYLIEAIKLLSTRHDKIKTVIIGDGPQREQLQRLIVSLNLSKSVILAGYRNQAFNYLHFFDVFVLPSLTEGLPISLLEALQAGIPVIATEVGGVPDLLGNGKYGILVKPGHPEAIMEAIWSSLLDSQSARSMAEGAKRMALSKFTSRRMAERYLQVYETILNKSTH